MNVKLYGSKVTEAAVAAENAAIVSGVVSVAQQVLVCQPASAESTRTVLALIAASDKALWARVRVAPSSWSEGQDPGTGDFSSREDVDGSDACSSDDDASSESDDDFKPVPNIKTLQRMCSRYRRKRAKHDAGALLAGLSLNRRRIQRSRLTADAQTKVVSFMLRVGNSTPVAYGVQKVKPLGADVIIAANHRLASYRSIHTAFVGEHGTGVCSFASFYRIACVLTPKRVQVRVEPATSIMMPLSIGYLLRM
jgi:hypothetical protein